MDTEVWLGVLGLVGGCRHNGAVKRSVALAARPVLLRERGTPRAQPSLTAAQQAVVRHRGGPLLVLAGPGTGKTTTLVEAMAARLEAARVEGTGSAAGDPHSHRLLGLTFGRAAAADWRHRLQRRLGAGAVPPVQTFHSFAANVLAQAGSTDTVGWGLMTAGEQQAMVRELLEHSSDPAWSAQWDEARATVGFADAVIDFMTRAKSTGWTPSALRAAVPAGAPQVWAALAGFIEEYDAVAAMRGAQDYTALLAAAVAGLRAGDITVPALDAVYVDEYQDTDPLQVELLELIVAQGADLIVVGDPDQAIYRFRGADVRGLLGFRGRFSPTGDPVDVPVAVLDECRRYGPALGAAINPVVDRIPVHGIPAEALRRHRRPSMSGPDTRVRVIAVDDEAAEAAHVVDRIHRWLVEDAEGSRSPGDVAVLARNAAQLQPVATELLRRGIPVRSAGPDLTLAGEHVVEVLLGMLELAAQLATAPEHSDAGDSVWRRWVPFLATSGMWGLEQGVLRDAGRRLRREAMPHHLAAAEPVPTAADLLWRVVRSGHLPASLAGHPAAATLAALHAAIGRCAAAIGSAAPLTEVLWAAWTSAPQGRKPWPHRLREQALRGGADSVRAHRDLDAAIELFERAERSDQQAGGTRRVRGFLEEVRGLSVRSPSAEPPVRRSAVTLLTAHRAKGLQWPFVAVVGVQEGVWPAQAGSEGFLDTDRLHMAEPGVPQAPGVAGVLADERRLFFVACTRPQEQLLVSAVVSAEEDPNGVRPSRFLTELAAPVARLAGRPKRELDPGALAVRLRKVLNDPANSAQLRREAAVRLAVLAADLRGDGLPANPAAHPDHWWGVHSRTPGAAPIRPTDKPVALSASGLSMVDQCQVRWLLERELAAGRRGASAAAAGTVLHWVAEQVVAGRVSAAMEDLRPLLESTWPEHAFESDWLAARKLHDAHMAAQRLLTWHGRVADDAELEAEAVFDVVIDLRDDQVRLRGAIDVIVADDSGNAEAVDFKTSKVVPSRQEVGRHVQLATYQRVIAERGGTPNGGRLVHLSLRAGADAEHEPRTLVQPPLAEAADGEWLEGIIGEAVMAIRGETFTATPGPHCRGCAVRLLCPVRVEGREVVA